MRPTAGQTAGPAVLQRSRRHSPSSRWQFPRIPATVHLALAGMLLAIGVGVPLGIISAVKRDTILDRDCKAFAFFGMAAPQ